MRVVIFLPSDLNRRGRAILNAARQDVARIRDTDGTSLVVLPEERVRALEIVARAASNLALLEEILDHSPTPSPESLAAFDWAWLRVFDPEDLQEFVREARGAVVAAFRDRDPRLVDDLLHRWRVTAQALDDPLRRAILYGPVKLEDFIEVARPEAAAPGE
jgi:hypothetical protein